MSRSLRIAALTAFSIISSNAFAADYVKSMDLHPLLPGPTVKVYGSGQSYKTVPDQSMSFNTVVESSCKKYRFLKSQQLISANAPQSGSIYEATGDQWGHVSRYRSKKSREFGAQFVLNTKVSKLGSNGFNQPGQALVNSCNVEMNKRIGQGASKFSLLKNGFKATMLQPITLIAQCAKNINSNKYTLESVVKMATVNVECQPINNGVGNKVIPPAGPKPKPNGVGGFKLK